MANGDSDDRMGKARLYLCKGKYTKGSGSKVSEKDLGSSNGLTDVDMRGIGYKGRYKVKGSFNGLMERIMKGSGKMGSGMGKECIDGVMEMNILVHG